MNWILFIYPGKTASGSIELRYIITPGTVRDTVVVRRKLLPTVLCRSSRDMLAMNSSTVWSHTMKSTVGTERGTEQSAVILAINPTLTPQSRSWRGSPIG